MERHYGLMGLQNDLYNRGDLFAWFVGLIAFVFCYISYSDLYAMSFVRLLLKWQQLVSVCPSVRLLLL